MNSLIQAALKTWQKWPVDAEPTLVREFDSGLNNTVALLRCGSTNLVLKCFSGNPDPGVSVQTWASALGIAPNIIYYSEPSRFCLMEYCASEQTAALTGTNQLISLADSLSRLHRGETEDLTENDKERWNLESWLRHYDARMQESCSEAFYLSMVKTRQQIYPAFTTFINDPTPYSLCHNDLVTENCFVGEQQTRFIDWEFAQLNNPWFDLASVSHYFSLNDDQTAQLLRAYNSANNSKIEFANSKVLRSAKCAVIWLDILWHVDKFGSPAFAKQKEKLALLHQYSDDSALRKG